ncbi:MAG TPA: MTH938/NDUFAF3 family protein [Pseudolabrys sp.]|nr:MTH938/NDUFAF3 family protein [Pseudolabrys sp.]
MANNRPGADLPHLPSAAPIDAYGNGGFRFAGMSHRGSLLCLPDGIWPLPVGKFDELTEERLALAFARGTELDMFLIGCGPDMRLLPDGLRARFHDLHISVDAMPTGAAVRTYNILLAERRRVGAALIAVD